MKSIKPIATGNTAEILLSGDRAIKVYSRGSEATAQLEAENQRLAREAGLSVPEMYEITRHEGHPAIVMEYLPGPTLGTLIERDPEQGASWLERSVDLQIGMHALSAPGLQPLTTRLHQTLTEVTTLSRDQRDQLLELLGTLPRESHICHGDFHVHNIILRNDELFIIDWMDATSGDIRYDICRSYVIYGMIHQRIADLYLSRYCEQSGLSAEEILVWKPIVAAARLWEHIPPAEHTRLQEIVSTALPRR